MKQTNTLEIIEFTDPVCTWCWASEPVLRALKARYAHQLDISFIAGGLVKDIRNFEDVGNEIGGNPSDSNKQIAVHWLEASQHHGMPVTTGPLQLFSAEHPSSYPQNIAYKAAQFEDHALADKFLRRLREATAVEAKQTNREDVLLTLAQEVGLDREKLLSHYSDGSALAAFEEDLATARAYRVRLFPTFILRYKGKEVIMENYQRVEDFEQAIRTLSKGELTSNIPEASRENILAFIRTHDRVVPLEIMMTFALDKDETMKHVHALAQDKLVSVQKAGNGLFVDALL